MKNFDTDCTNFHKLNPCNPCLKECFDKSFCQAQIENYETGQPQNHIMKTDLYKLSDRLCKLGGLAFLIHWVYPAAPDFLMGFATIAIIAGLVVTLADEITARKQRERAAKPAIEPR